MSGRVNIGGDVHAGDSNRRIISEINVTPMVDIMLVLLIIFMVTATYITRGAFDLKLSKAQTAGDVAKSPIQVSIASDGALSMNGDVLDVDDLLREIKPLIKDNPDVQAVVDGDRGVAYGRVMEIIDVLKTAGVRNFAAAVERTGGTAGAAGSQ